MSEGSQQTSSGSTTGNPGPAGNAALPAWTNNRLLGGIGAQVITAILSFVFGLLVVAVPTYFMISNRLEKVETAIKKAEEDAINALALNNILTNTNNDVAILKTAVANLQSQYAALTEWKSHVSETVKSMDCSTVSLRERVAKIEAKNEGR